MRKWRWFFLSFHLLWLSVVILLGGWWGHLMLLQAERIAQLEQASGLSASSTVVQLSKTQRMLFWESSVFFALIIGGGIIVLVLYWRDLRRGQMIQNFFAGLTHELKTPLTSIRLQAESIAEQTEEKNAIKRLTDRLLEDTSRLESQVEKTLELARVEGGGKTFTQPIELSGIAKRLLAERSSDRFSLSTQVDDCMVQADPSAIQIILRNLFDNSIRHGQKALVKATLRAERKEGGWLLIRYQDNGSGYKGDSRQLGKIFNKGPRSQGAGIGLYLVKTLMKRMGGRAEFIVRSGFEANLWFKEATR